MVFSYSPFVKAVRAVGAVRAGSDFLYQSVMRAHNHWNDINILVGSRFGKPVFSGKAVLR